MKKENSIQLVHGTTVATNSLLEKSGDSIALITTKGFEDILFIGRQTRTKLYHLKGEARDLMAQIAANNRGKAQLKKGIEKFGLNKMKKYASFIQDYTEKILRKTIKAIPDGEYEFLDHMDDDGIDEKPVKIGVKITIWSSRGRKWKKKVLIY